MNCDKRFLAGFSFLFLFILSVAAIDKTANDLVADATKEIKTITAQEAKLMIDGGNVVILDVREQDEHDAERIPQSVLIPRGMLEFQITAKYPQKDTVMIIYCLKGGRGALAAHTLKIMGYTKVVNLNGGLVAWQAAKYPTEKAKK